MPYIEEYSGLGKDEEEITTSSGQPMYVQCFPTFFIDCAQCGYRIVDDYDDPQNAADAAYEQEYARVLDRRIVGGCWGVHCDSCVSNAEEEDARAWRKTWAVRPPERAEEIHA